MNKKALTYHASFPAGKLETLPTKPLNNLNDLELAYSPGVAAPCQAIVQKKSDVYRYTNRGNLVAVITNGTAVLGLGNIGPEAAKPVMEGKAILLKRLAGIDAFDLEINATEPRQLVDIIASLAPTFGGINLEDIQAPDCFQVTQELAQRLAIPVIHDDQHSTAIVVAAALKNALLLVNKHLKHLRTVIYGAGASALATAHLLVSMGLSKTNLVMFDSQGMIHQQRAHLPEAKAPFAAHRPMSLVEAMHGADFFLGLSVGDVLHPDYLRCMARNPIVFALANPQPEINYSVAHATRRDIIMGTGRSDYPNQINNVLAFPSIFRGLLDVRATSFNRAIQKAAVEAIASLVQLRGSSSLDTLHKKYLLPNPLDERLLPTVATAVARAAIHTHVAQCPIHDWRDYPIYLQQRLGV